VKMTRVLLLAALAPVLAAGAAVVLSAADDPGDEVVQMIISLVSDKDKDMRTVGLQQVREEAKGPAATKKFAALLPKLSPDAQAGLLDALADRGDASARPAALEMLNSREEQVRAAAIRALGPLGESADVPLLTQSLAAADASQKAAARASLARLRGPEVNAAVIAELKRAKPGVRAALLDVLAARRATESVPALLQAAGDADAAVRMSALGALRVLADPGQTAAVVKLLKAAKGGQEQWKAELALLAVCTRGKEACVEPILANLPSADESATAALLRALGRSGGAKALAAVAELTKDARPLVRSEAVRVLASWPDLAAVPYLRAIAQQAEPIAQQAVAVQGLVRLAGPAKDRPADTALLSEAMKLSRRPEDKRIVLGTLGALATPEALALVAPVMDDPVLADEACLAVVLIAEKATGIDAARRRAVLEKAGSKAKDPQIRRRAQDALRSLGKP
jgi:HEAT repeat protein